MFKLLNYCQGVDDTHFCLSGLTSLLHWLFLILVVVLLNVKIITQCIFFFTLNSKRSHPKDHHCTGLALRGAVKQLFVSFSD